MSQRGKKQKPAEHPVEEDPSEETVDETEQTVLSLAEEADRLCGSLEKFIRSKVGDMPSSMDMTELRSQQAAIRDLVNRAEETGAKSSEELIQTRAERDREKDNAARAKADFLNYQTRAQNDLKRAEELALRGYVSDLLPILDSLDLAVADIGSGKADLKRVSEAFTMLSQAFEQTLKVRGLERISALGKEFDPAFHEAVATRPVDEAAEEKPNQVAEEFRPGYLWKGLLLRPAQVLVTQATAEKASAPKRT